MDDKNIYRCPDCGITGFWWVPTGSRRTLDSNARKVAVCLDCETICHILSIGGNPFPNNTSGEDDRYECDTHCNRLSIKIIPLRTNRFNMEDIRERVRNHIEDYNSDSS